MMAKLYTAQEMRDAILKLKAFQGNKMTLLRIEDMLRQAADDIDRNEKMRKEVDLYKKTFRKICGCLNKDIEVGATIHKVDGSSTFFISDCGAMPIIFEIAKIIKDTVKEGENGPVCHLVRREVGECEEVVE